MRKITGHKAIKTVLAILSILLMAMSCINHKKNDENNIDLNFDKTDTTGFHKIVSEYSIIKLETSTASKINIIKKAIVRDDRFYILNHHENRQEILIFSIMGDYITKISGINEERSRFSGIIDFDIHPTTHQIHLLDPALKSIVVFDEIGNYIKSFKISGQPKELAFGIANGKTFTVVHNEYPQKNTGTLYEITIYDDENKITNTYFPFEMSNHPVRNQTKAIVKRGEKVMYLQKGTGSIYEIAPNGYNKHSNLCFSKPVLPNNKEYAAFFSGEVDLSNYIYGLEYLESNRILYTTFSSSNGDFVGIYNKLSGKSSLFNLLTDPNCNCGIKIHIVGAHQNYFIVQVPRTKITGILNVIDYERNKCINGEMLENIDQMKPGENPILLLLELKV